MKKKIFALIVGIISVISMTGLASATGPASATSTSWGAGNTISSQWLNSVGTLITSLLSTTGSTSTPLGTISAQATTTGNILVASTTKGWVALAVGANGQCPIASSTASLGIAWGTCGGSINGTLASSYFLTASGVGFSVSTNGATTTFTLASSSYLQPLNNLSELTNTSTARNALGLNSLYMKQASSGSDAASSSTFTTNIGALRTTNNLSDLTSTSSARTNIGYTAGSGITISGSGSISAASTNVAGTSSDIQFNQGGVFAADTGNFTYGSTTKQLSVVAPLSSILIGNSFTPNPTFSSSSLFLAAAGGGGALNGACGVSNGGYGGGTTGGTGGGATAGVGGTQSAGGASGGTGNATAGTSGQGGNGETSPNNGGGGGGGYYGGGGGSNNAGGGGGGSSYILASSLLLSTSTATSSNSGNGFVVINYGTSSSARFNYTGAPQYWPVPSGIATATFSLYGAQGGSPAGATGGKGGAVTSTISVLNGENFVIQVGQQATSSSVGGYGGGGTGSTSCGTPSGGGGMTWVYAITSPASSYSLAVGGHIITGGSTPTVSSCGTTPTNSGNDTAGVITIGTSPGSTCQLTFAQSYVNVPIPSPSGNNAISTVSTSSVTWNIATASSSGKIYYQILGY